jgi:hypothetical protein
VSSHKQSLKGIVTTPSFKSPNKNLDHIKLILYYMPMLSSSPLIFVHGTKNQHSSSFILDFWISNY